MKATTHDGKIDHFTFHDKNEGPRKYPLLPSKIVNKCNLLLVRQQG